METRPASHAANPLRSSFPFVDDNTQDMQPAEEVGKNPLPPPLTSDVWQDGRTDRRNGVA